MGTCAGSQIRPLRRVAALMILSDACLGLFFAILPNPLLHVGAIALFDTALVSLVFASEHADMPANRPGGLKHQYEESAGTAE